MELVTEAAASTNTIGAHAHPVLEEGNLSFPRGRYVIDFVDRGDGSSFELIHRVEGARLISGLLKEGKARYGCIVSSPRSFYRRTHISVGPRQRITWDERELGEPPLFRPVVLCSSTETLVLRAERDHVHPAWDGVQVVLPKGARLALGDVFDLRSSVMQMIRMEVDDTLEGNRFQVQADTEPFSFVVKASRSLHQFVRTTSADKTRSNILTHVVTACFALLQRRFSDPEEWDRNLERLAQHISTHYPHRWDEDDFQPEVAAMSLYPHILPSREEEA